MNRGKATGIVIGATACAAFFTAAAGLMAQGVARPDRSGVASLDVGRVFGEYQRKKDLNEELKQWQDRLEAENQARRQKIDSKQATVDAMDPDDPAAQSHASELLMMQIDYRNWAEMMQAELQREDSLWTAKLYREILAATEQVAKAGGYDIVVYRDDFQPAPDPQRLREQIFARRVLYCSPGSDISQAVLDKLNADYRLLPRQPMLRVNTLASPASAAPPPAPQPRKP